MNALQAVEYAALRRHGWRAVDAFRAVQEPTDQDAYDHAADMYDSGARDAVWTAGPYQMRATIEPDEGLSLQDLGYGTFEDGREDWRSGYWHPETPGAIPNPNRDSRAPGNGARYYIPSEPLADWTTYARQRGASKSVALDEARARQADEATRATRDYGPTADILTVTASRAGIELGRASLGGMDTNPDAYGLPYGIARRLTIEYVAESLADLTAEAIEEADKNRPILAAALAS